MALLGSALTSEVGLQLLLYPLGSNIVIRTACCSVGIAYPIYSTFKAIEKDDRHERDRWLLYWAAYGSFSLVEVFSDKILSWFPLYYHMKFVFLVWLQLPSGNGSRHLYARHLRPFLLRHQARVDRLLSFSSREIAKFTSSHQKEIHFLMDLIKKCALTANQLVKAIVHRLQSRGPKAIEGPDAPVARLVLDSDSDSDGGN